MFIFLKFIYQKRVKVLILHIIILPKEQMSRHFLFFCSYSYAIPILRPLEEEIKRRGDEVAWFMESSCDVSLLTDSDRQLHSTKEVKTWNPEAVFAPGIFVYDFFPGVKVEVFHGYPIYKRGGTEETHFRIRGWFDIYLSTGPSSTPIFLDQEKKYGHFKTYETGWAKVDTIVKARRQAEKTPCPDHTPTIFVSTTFSKNVTQLRNLFPTIKRLSGERDWKWIITMHPKLDDPELRDDLTKLAETRSNVTFMPLTPDASVMAKTDVMLCDASSIILEYMMLDKPVVTLCNTTPGPHLIDVKSPDDVECAIDKALTRPSELMAAIKEYVGMHEAHTDGHNCERIMDAVDDFIKNYKGKLKRKPLNLFRKIKLRIKLLRSKP